MAEAVATTTVGIRGTRYPVVLPRLSDPRMHVAAVLVSVQVLGQTVLRFDVSIAQILLTIGLCAAIEVPMVAFERGVLAWPASALLTGNGIALLMRTPGTEWGDWWSLNGWPAFVAAAVVAMMSKYAIRHRGRHIFNPSNFGLVVVFLTFGAAYADPQVLWWGPWNPGLYATVGLIVVGGLTLSLRLGLLGLVSAFWATFAAGIGILALAGHEMVARWSIDPVAGLRYWAILVTSPELMIFAFFMITDPPTTPKGRRARIAYAVAVGALAALLSATQVTEFGTKVSLLAALTLVCAARPLLESMFEEKLPDMATARIRLAALGAVVVYALALLGLNSAFEQDFQIPEVPLRSGIELGDLPSPTVRESVTRTAEVDPALATMVLTDVVADLETESEALASGDTDGLAESTLGARLEAIEQRMAANRAEGLLEERHYGIEAAELVLLRDPASPQAVPELGLLVSAKVDMRRWNEGDGSVLESSSDSVREVFRVARVGDRYLIRESMEPDATMVTT